MRSPKLLRKEAERSSALVEHQHFGAIGFWNSSRELATSTIQDSRVICRSETVRARLIYGADSMDPSALQFAIFLFLASFNAGTMTTLQIQHYALYPQQKGLRGVRPGEQQGCIGAGDSACSAASCNIHDAAGGAAAIHERC